MNSFLSPKVLVTFIAAILLISACSFLYLISSSQLTYNSVEIETVHQRITTINKITSLIKDIERGQNGYFITGDQQFLRPYSYGLELIDKEIEKLDSLLGNDIEQRIKFNTLKIFIDQKINNAKTAKDLIENKRIREGKELVAKGEILMDKIIKGASQIEAVEMRRLSFMARKFNFNSISNLIIILGGLTVTLLVILLGVKKILSELRTRQHLETELFNKNRELSIKNGELEKTNKDLHTANETIRDYNEQAIKEQIFLFKNVVDNFPSPFFIFSKDNVLEFINNSGLKSFKLTSEKALNKTPDEIFPEDKAFIINRYHANALLYKKPCQTEFTLTIEKTECTFLTRFVPLCDENQQVSRVLVITYDITDRKDFENKMLLMNEELEQKVKDRTYELEKLNEELTSQSSEITDLYNNAPIGYFSTDKDGNFLKVNDTTLKLLGYTRNELLGENITSIIPETNRESFINMITEFIKAGRIEHQETEYKKRDNSLLPVLIFGTGTYSEEGDFIMSRMAFIDNTELKKAKIEKEKFLEALESANKELESFSYSISHDLRAPLRSIEGFSIILKNDFDSKLDEEGRKFLDLILYNTEQMGKLIEDLLSFAKLGKKGMHKSYFNMEHLISEVISTSVDSSDSDHINVSVDPMPFIVADRNLIKQTWVNLINNAIKFSSSQNTSEIFIGYQENEEFYTFCIRDNGVGFDPKYADKLFKVFQRLHTYEEFEGTGVGLAIVQRIINSHGGKVWAENNLESGATFYFSLPKN